MQKVFSQDGDFKAMYAAEAWCAQHGISSGCSERGSPRGLLFGNYSIAKWSNLSKVDRAALHGTMTGDMRNGPVSVQLTDSHIAVHAPQLLEEGATQ